MIHSTAKRRPHLDVGVAGAQQVRLGTLVLLSKTGVVHTLVQPRRIEQLVMAARGRDDPPSRALPSARVR